MADRRALVIGTWLAQGRDKPSPQKVKSITDRWTKLFAEDRYGFRSLGDRRALPVPLQHPTRADLIHQFDGAQGVTDDTELFLFFLGHSVSEGNNDIRLILGVDKGGEDRTVSLSWLFKTVNRETPIRKLVVVLDTCHSGRTQETFHPSKERVFVMFSTGTSWAFDANFSDSLLRALEQPIQKSDQRIDRRSGGITWRKIFEEARRRVISAQSRLNPLQDPECFGGYTGEVLFKAPTRISTGFNAFASSRSIYGRVFRLLRIIAKDSPTSDALRASIRADPVFLLRRDESGVERHVSIERLDEYLDFLIKAKWLVRPKGHFELTPSGHKACDENVFNMLLLQAIESDVLSDGLSFEFLDEIVKELLSDMIPPTPIRIKHRAGMKGKILRLDPATRLAIQLLPSTGQFLKGTADAIFPSELGG
ncbi:hypothetical protein X769_22585 [Mesorhizobium sp. LSJC268A00]|uniref:caspase family protein n=1 Tax=unclassified Mesorhizobium TaxID=325217 RepID=UPI0003CF80AA|nr:caspase family protein [Mesorhizobium sp. LSJC268A00]ESX00685.1 hypothetical protein X769_22585 [Mesorhizobium sp. LSJC268A00]